MVSQLAFVFKVTFISDYVAVKYEGQGIDRLPSLSIHATLRSRRGAELAMWHLSSKHSLVHVTQHQDSPVSNVAVAEK